MTGTFWGYLTITENNIYACICSVKTKSTVIFLRILGTYFSASSSQLTFYLFTAFPYFLAIRYVSKIQQCKLRLNLQVK